MKKLLPAILGLIVIIISACNSSPPAPSPEPAPTLTASQAGTSFASETAYPPDPGYPEPLETGGETLMNETYPSPSETNSLAPGDSLPGSAFPPIPTDTGLNRGVMFIDQAGIQPARSGQGFELFLEGSLPTPCHALRVSIRRPDANNRIEVEVYSVTDPEKMCTQVIKPFTGLAATFTELPPGAYQVIVNGKPAGEFTVP